MGYDSKITSKGQTTIPVEVRERLGLKPGDMLDYEVKDGLMIVRKKRSALELAGILHDPERKALSLEEMENAIAGGIVERYERSLDRD